MRHPPVVLGIVGKPLAERLALAEGVAHMLGGEQYVSRISIESYRKFSREDGVKEAVTAAHPAAIRLDMLEQHLSLLKRGEAILRPDYNEETDAFEPAVYIEPRPFVVVDGELGFFTQGMRNNFDLRAFYAAGDAVTAWPSELAEDAATYVESQRKWADMVVERLSPEGGGEAGALALTLRPTLPHLALQGLMQTAGEQHGMRLELARDMGMPVDQVVIDAAISSKAVTHFIKRLSAEIPSEYRHDRAASEADEERSADAGSLALAQILVALHLLKAVSG